MEATKTSCKLNKKLSKNKINHLTNSVIVETNKLVPILTKLLNYLV